MPVNCQKRKNLEMFRRLFLVFPPVERVSESIESGERHVTGTSSEAQDIKKKEADDENSRPV